MNTNLRLGALTVATIVVGACAVGAQPRYRAVELPRLGDPGILARGINNAGQIVGVTRSSRAFSCQRGTIYDLCPGFRAVACAVNNSGCSAGFIWLDYYSKPRAIRFSRDGATELGTLGGPASKAFGINNSGDIVGIADLPGDEGSRAFLWRSGRMVDLGTLGGRRSAAHAINDRGDIVGEAELPDGESHAFLYRNGRMEDLGFRGLAYALNNRAQVVGTGYLPQSPGKSSAFLYDRGKVLDLGSLGEAGAEAYGINSSGTVVGRAFLTPMYSKAFVFVDGKMYELDDLLVNPIPGYWGMNSAFGINESGQIIAVMEIKYGPGVAWLLTPVDEENAAVDE